MSSYAFWNNKGGVGKSFLVFITACEYAHRHPETDVYVIDLCPQANVSETLLGGYLKGGKALAKLMAMTPRMTIAGYLDARLNSPFRQVDDVSAYVSHPTNFNPNVPRNLKLICGDNLLEVQSEAIRQTSQLSIPSDAWRQVICWIRDLGDSLKRASGDREAVVFIDCNPSFAVFTQMALVAADDVVVPFTADDSSRRGILNVIALLYGVGEGIVSTYSRLSFATKAKQEGVKLPALHTFVSNRQTFYRQEPSSAFRAVNQTIKDAMDQIHSKHRTLFSTPRDKPSSSFIDVPDYHSACVVAAYSGIPLHKLGPGPKTLGDERVQINPTPLSSYKDALESVVDRF